MCLQVADQDSGSENGKLLWLAAPRRLTFDTASVLGTLTREWAGTQEPSRCKTSTSSSAT